MRYFLAAFLGILLTVGLGFFLLKDKVSFQIVQKTPEASSLASPSPSSMEYSLQLRKNDLV